MHYNIYTKKSKLLRTFNTLNEVKKYTKLSNEKLEMLSNGVTVNRVGLVIVAMEWEHYLYYGKTKVREIYYHKPTYTLDNIPKTYKKIIKYSPMPMANTRLSLSSKSDYFSQQYQTN